MLIKMYIIKPEKKVKKESADSKKELKNMKFYEK